MVEIEMDSLVTDGIGVYSVPDLGRKTLEEGTSPHGEFGMFITLVFRAFGAEGETSVFKFTMETTHDEDGYGTLLERERRWRNAGGQGKLQIFGRGQILQDTY